MAAIPHRLETSVRGEVDRQRDDLSRADPLPEPALEPDDRDAEIPIFCAGGCGEVMGFFRKGQSVPAYRCPACRAVEAAQKSPASATVVAANPDELAELRSPPRDLRLIHIFQVLAVVLIFAGSVCIAIGRPLGITLAAVGTLVWVAVAAVRWKLRD